MLDENKLTTLIEEIDPNISQERITELVQAFKNLEENPPQNGEVQGDLHFSTLGSKILKESVLKEEMDKETDWRKKASIAAKIISLNLE